MRIFLYAHHVSENNGTLQEKAASIIATVDPLEFHVADATGVLPLLEAERAYWRGSVFPFIASINDDGAWVVTPIFEGEKSTIQKGTCFLLENSDIPWDTEDEHFIPPPPGRPVDVDAALARIVMTPTDRKTVRTPSQQRQHSLAMDEKYKVWASCLGKKASLYVFARLLGVRDSSASKLDSYFSLRFAREFGVSGVSLKDEFRRSGSADLLFGR